MLYNYGKKSIGKTRKSQEHFLMLNFECSLVNGIREMVSTEV